MRNSWDFCQGVWGASSLSFLSADSAGPGLDDRSKLFETLTVSLIFFSYTLSRNKGAEKTASAQAGLGICCSNVSKANFS